MKNIYDVTFEELQDFLVENKVPKFRAKQVWQWLYKKNVTSFEEMTNVDAKTLNALVTNFEFPNFSLISSQMSNDGTLKALMALNDKQTIETVLLKYKHGNSVCVTTQVGCKIGCSFCASHLGGFVRNLTPGEIVAQVMYFAKDHEISNIVVMGTGEPFDNLENVLKFIDVVNDHNGLDIGARRITVSTSGIVPKIYDFAEYDKQVNLAISLHATNDTLRSNLMKINDTYQISDIMKAVNYYINQTNRRVTFEYILLKDVNDSIKEARQLVELLRGVNCHVNIIPFNPVSEFAYKKSDNAKEFSDYLAKHKIQVTVRSEKGNDIDGACGQLRFKNA